MSAWSGIPPVIPDQPCDVCGSKTNVESGQVEVTDSPCCKSSFSHIQSNLCKSCKEQGWVIFGRASLNGRITYYKAHGREFREFPKR